MKTLTLISIIALFVLSGCEEDRLVLTYKGYVTNNNYEIAYFETSGVNKTQNYTNFSIYFLQDGKLEATAGAIKYKGAWDIYVEIDRETNQKKYRLNIEITGTAELDEMSNKWLIVSLNTDYIQLGLPQSIDKDKLELSKIE